MNAIPIYKWVVSLISLLLLNGCMSVLPVLAPDVKNHELNIGSTFDIESSFAEVLGSSMHYVEAGEGQPILLIHGNPTSSYLWRNVIPLLQQNHRVIALDLIGMGRSGKPDIPYRFDDHAKYLQAFVDSLGLKNITLVLHDWGGALGIDYAARNPGVVKCIALMEALVKPVNWSDASIVERYMFSQFRDERNNKRLLLEQNYFVEKMLPMMTGRRIRPEELANYRAPFSRSEDRLPLAQWPKEIPISGEPIDNHSRIASNYRWLVNSNVPVLLLYANPGALIKEQQVVKLREEIPRLDSKSVGEGLHFIQETSPRKIGNYISNWLNSECEFG